MVPLAQLLDVLFLPFHATFTSRFLHSKRLRLRTPWSLHLDLKRIKWADETRALLLICILSPSRRQRYFDAIHFVDVLVLSVGLLAEKP